ncbi:hypothetical protein VTK26DRAFT_5268 [Humicola hyalothermophila]
MLLLTFTLLAAVHLQVAAALQTYQVPISMLTTILENGDCTLPKKFMVRAFVVWTPAPGNDGGTTTLDFGYADNGTSIDTQCHYNSSSANVGPKGSAARYACENRNVEFIWQRGSLTLIERACPGSAAGNLEAASSITPDLGYCLQTEANSTRGEGTACFDFRFHDGSFFSLQPAPRE